MSLWTGSEAASATKGKVTGYWEAGRVEIDSRRVQKGDLFIALKGENFDGHDYVKAALDKGAIAAMVSRAPEGVDADKLLIVADTQQGLEDMGRAGRARSQAKIIGVTGSVGKTSAKEMLKLALSAHGKTYATSGNFNNHIGAPLNLANLPPAMQFAVFEMGMNHAGEIKHLTSMVRPHVAAITNVEAVHLEFFENIEGIAEAKSEIFIGMDGGIAVLNRDNPHYALMARRAHERGTRYSVTFGAQEKSDCRLISYKPQAKGCAIEASIHGKRMNYTLQAVGKHWALTSLLTLAVTHALGLDDAITTRALAGFAEVEGRGQLIEISVSGGHAVLIDDSYNASPAAMRAAFTKTAEVWQGAGHAGRKLAALGNMLELGDSAPELHAGLAPDILQAGFDKVFTCGDFMNQLHGALPSAMRGAHADTPGALLAPLMQELKPGDILLVKGSHGSKIYTLVTSLKDNAKGDTGLIMETMHAV